MGKPCHPAVWNRGRSTPAQRGAGSRYDTHPPSLSPAVAAVLSHSAAPGQPDRDRQKSLPSGDRVAVAILTCSEQAHSGEAAGDPAALREKGVGEGMSPSLPAGFLDTCLGTQSIAHRQGKENL